MAPGVQLFGHACANGGVILRPGSSTRVKCGHGKDSGAGACASGNTFCPPTSSVATGLDGPPCGDAWHPSDVHAYLKRETDAYRRAPGWGHYNEFIVDGHVWDRSLPQAIEAFMSGGNAKAVHAAFLAKYRLDPRETPLLTMTNRIERPFVVGDQYSSEGDPTRLP